MEASLFILDAFVMVVVLYMGLADEQRSATTKLTSPFRMLVRKDLKEAAKKTARDLRSWR